MPGSVTDQRRFGGAPAAPEPSSSTWASAFLRACSYSGLVFLNLSRHFLKSSAFVMVLHSKFVEKALREI